MHKQEIAFNIIPAALAKLTEARNTEALQVLAENSGMDLRTFMTSFGHHAIAKFLYEGATILSRSFVAFGVFTYQYAGCLRAL